MYSSIQAFVERIFPLVFTFSHEGIGNSKKNVKYKMTKKKVLILTVNM